MKTIDRVQGLIDYLGEEREADGECRLHDYEVDMIIKDLTVIKQEIEAGTMGR